MTRPRRRSRCFQSDVWSPKDPQGCRPRWRCFRESRGEAEQGQGKDVIEIHQEFYSFVVVFLPLVAATDVCSQSNMTNQKNGEDGKNKKTGSERRRQRSPSGDDATAHSPQALRVDLRPESLLTLLPRLADRRISRNDADSRWMI